MRSHAASNSSIGAGNDASALGTEYVGLENLEVMSAAEKYNASLYRVIVESVGPPEIVGEILDFGAGTGTFAIPLRGSGYDVYAVEPDERFRKHLGTLGLESAPDLGNSADRFDAAYTFNVLEHIERDDEALRQLVQSLRPGGRVVVYVPAMQFLFSAMDRRVGHVRRYGRSELVALARGAGLSVETCRFVDSLGVVATLLFKIFGSRSGTPSSSSVAIYDRFIFPVSLLVDRIAGRWFGKNLLLVGSRL
jgi:SAM-dependent methyltransferase